MDDMYVLVSVGLCIFVFLAILLGIGQFYGGQWNIIAQGVVKFILLIVAFAFAALVIVRLMKK